MKSVSSSIASGRRVTERRGRGAVTAAPRLLALEGRIDRTIEAAISETLSETLLPHAMEQMETEMFLSNLGWTFKKLR